MKVKQYLEDIWNQQYPCPHGIVGWLAGERMVRQHRPETAWTLDLLDIQPADTVLEVGCGAGQGIKLAAEKASDGRVLGIDLSEVMVRVATRRNAQAVKAGRVALSQGNMTALPFEDQHFDKIMTIHTFYFWSEPTVILAEIVRVLKPGGMCIITFTTGKVEETGLGHYQAILEERMLPGMRNIGFTEVSIKHGPIARQYKNVAVIGRKEPLSICQPSDRKSTRLNSSH